MTAYEPWRYRMPDCGSHAWRPHHRAGHYTCRVCGDTSPVLYDKKLGHLVKKPGDRADASDQQRVVEP